MWTVTPFPRRCGFRGKLFLGANERPSRIPVRIRRNALLRTVRGNISEGRQKGKRGCTRFPQDWIFVGASMGLEIVWNRATRGIWNFSVSVSKALAFDAGTVSHLYGNAV